MYAKPQCANWMKVETFWLTLGWGARSHSWITSKEPNRVRETSSESSTPHLNPPRRKQIIQCSYHPFTHCLKSPPGFPLSAQKVQTPWLCIPGFFSSAFPTLVVTPLDQQRTNCAVCEWAENLSSVALWALILFASISPGPRVVSGFLFLSRSSLNNR